MDSAIALERAVSLVEAFVLEDGLRARVVGLEAAGAGRTREQIAEFLAKEGINGDLLVGARELKRVARQVNVIIGRIRT